MNKIKQAVKQIARWALKEELDKLSKIQDESVILLSKAAEQVKKCNDYNSMLKGQYQRLNEILGNMEV